MYFSDTKTQTLAPLILQLCATCMKEEGVALMALAKDMGILFTHLNGCIGVADGDVLVAYFIELGRRGLDIKKNYYYQHTDTSQVNRIIQFKYLSALKLKKNCKMI